MPSHSRKRTLTFSLAGLFVLTTLAAVFLGLGRVFGFTAYVAIPVLVMAPLPTLGYLVLVRSMSQRFSVEFQNRFAVNLGIFAGFMIAFFVSLAMAGYAVAIVTGTRF